MPRKPRQKTPKLPIHLELIPSQLDRIETKVDRVVARVDKLERKASFWGAIGGVVTVLVTHLSGCL